MNEDVRDVKIPIKAIVEEAMVLNGAKYNEDEFNLLRKYFIACLNLGYMMPKDLKEMVGKFASKIKLIVLNYNNVNKMDHYMISNGVLYISGILKDNNFDFYQINFYKAVTEIVFNSNDNHIGISNAICNMVAEKIYNMYVNQVRIVMPKTSYEIIGDKKIEIRAGYSNYNLIISLLKQLFIVKNINENKIIHDMYFDGYENVLNNILKDNSISLLLDVLDKLCILYIKRIVLKEVNQNKKQKRNVNN